MDIINIMNIMNLNIKNIIKSETSYISEYLYDCYLIKIKSY